MKIIRPYYGNTLEYDRILNVFFYTSNTDKLLQARLLFVRHGYELRHFKGKREPYDEDYALGTNLLLTEAIEQVNEEFAVRSIFFVEDTSLRVVMSERWERLSWAGRKRMVLENQIC